MKAGGGGGCPALVARRDGAEGVGMQGGMSWTKKWLTFDNSYFKKEYVEDPEVWPCPQRPPRPPPRPLDPKPFTPATHPHPLS
jgi:hypothetical protein